MVAVRGVKWKTAVRVLRAFLASASPMVGAGGASILPAQKVPKGAQRFVKRTVGEKGARFLGVLKAQKEAHPFVKAMVGGKGVHLKGGARRAFMGGPYFV